MNSRRNQKMTKASEGDEEMEALIGMTFESANGGPLSGLGPEEFHVSQLSCDVSFSSSFDEDNDCLMLEEAAAPTAAQQEPRDDSNSRGMERIFSQDQATKDVAPPRQPRLPRADAVMKHSSSLSQAPMRRSLSRSDPTSGMSLLSALAAAQPAAVATPPTASLWSLPQGDQAPTLSDILDCAMEEVDDVVAPPLMRRTSSMDLPPRMARRRGSIEHSEAPSQ